jgi:hypothetical protein
MNRLHGVLLFAEPLIRGAILSQVFPKVKLNSENFSPGVVVSLLVERGRMAAFDCLRYDSIPQRK